jgi:ribonuclease D
MLIKIFTLKFSPGVEGFDDEKIRLFMVGNEIISVREHFFIKDNVPYWTLLLAYNPGSFSKIPEQESQPSKTSQKDEYRKYLTEDSEPLYEALRDWRNTSAKNEKVPPYFLFKNIHLAQIASNLPENLNQLSSISGIGTKKTEKYGKEILEIVSSSSNKTKTDIPKKESQTSEQKNIPKTTEQSKEPQKSEQKNEKQMSLIGIKQKVSSPKNEVPNGLS